MKKTFILKYLLLMISLTFLYTTPAFASAGAIVGSVDVFNGTQISGWAYETASPLSSPDILLKITNTVTGETVSEIPAKPDSKRNDLVSQVGEEGTPAVPVPRDGDAIPVPEQSPRPGIRWLWIPGLSPSEAN